MKSRIRIFTILFSLAMLAAFVSVPYIIFYKKELTEINVATVMAFFMFLLFCCGIIAIVWLTLVLKIDFQQKEIIFFYPFRLKKTKLKFDEILGFRYKYLSGKIEYKALQIKSKSGQKFTFSDFETANLRDFENQFLNHLELRRGNSFTKLNEKNKEFEIQNSRIFDIEQAKEIRFMLYIAIIFCGFLLGSIIKKNFENTNEITTLKAIGILTLIIILTTLIVKLKKTIMTIKNDA